MAGALVVLAACGGDGGKESTKQTASTAVPSSTTAAPAATTTPPPATYVVKRGDTLTTISKFFHVSIEVLAMTNQLANGDQIAEGQVLQIPPAPPVVLTVTPPSAKVGNVFTFDLGAAIAGETVTFEVVAPDGSTFKGPPHSASPEGALSTTYRSTGDAPGTYIVVATGNRGTSIQVSFDITA